MSNGFSTDADADVVEAFFKTQALPVGTAFDVAGCRGDTQPRKVHRQDPGKHRHVRCQGVIVYDGVPALRVRSLLTVELWRRLNNRWHGTAMVRDIGRAHANVKAQWTLIKTNPDYPPKTVGSA